MPGYREINKIIKKAYIQKLKANIINLTKLNLHNNLDEKMFKRFSRKYS